MTDIKYIHDESLHNTTAPQEIVPILMKLLNPKSVVDVGCGIGTFLYCFKQQGVKQVLGIDGPWADKSLIKKYLGEGEFVEKNLENPFSLSQKFDLAISLEVAEHLNEASARAFVKNLTRLSDTIVFSAAVPYQGGQNHLNEQWPSYWESLFNEHGFAFTDAVRPFIWDNDKVFWWYKQNTFLVTKKGEPAAEALPTHIGYPEMHNLIHPELFTYNSKVAEASVKRLTLLEEGNQSIKVYAKLLWRAIMRKLGILNKNLPVIIFNSADPLQR